MRIRSVLALWLFTAVAFVGPASVQYMYIDTNGDGVNTSEDHLNTTGTTCMTMHAAGQRVCGTLCF